MSPSTRVATPIQTILSPFVGFAEREASGGIVLLLCTLVALIWANSPWESTYHSLWEAHVRISLGNIALSESRHEWVNDGLMAFFFFLVGLEIKREAIIGELSSLKQAAFPFLAAIGGVAVPAAIYFAINHSTHTERGWGIPMATDIAFALGVLALLGNRVPLALKVFVTALAIVDDIFGVLVIAVFYTEKISFLSLGLGLAGVALSYVANLAGIRKPAVYAFIGVFVWFAMLRSGVHATIAGVLLAFTIPVNTFIDRKQFVESSHALLDQVEESAKESADEHAAIHALEEQCELVQSPLHRIEHGLQPWVSFLIMPIFALANAGVHILGNMKAAASDAVALGVFAGLFLGKPIGIFAFAWLSTRTGLATAPAQVSWRQTFGASWLCGIGFTMSLFIATLAFDEGGVLDMAKIGILSASVASGICGSWFFLRTRAEKEVDTAG
jgi:NhaA family Na+:H+ antiporter